jgi:lysophospholipase
LAGVEARFGALRVAGYALACHHFRRPSARGTCFVLHGYLDHSGLFSRLAGHCLASGFDVVAWDLPGHGLSSGARATIDDFASYRRCWRGLVESLETEVTRPWLAIGQSTGAAVLLDDLRAGDGPDLAVRTLLAPLVHAGGWRSMRIGLPLLRPFRSRLRRHFVRNTSDDEFLRFQREDDPLQSRDIPLDWVAAMLRWSAAYLRWHGADVPLRVVQGDADRTVAWRDNLPLLERQFPNAQLVMVPGAGHQLANEGDELRARVFAALDLLDG